MTTELVQGDNLQQLLKWEAEMNHSREVVSLQAGEAVEMGQVLGQVKWSVPTTGVAGTNTGTGTMGSVTGGSKTKVGVYSMVCIAKVTNKGTFTVEDPDGLMLPNAIATEAYVHDQINFTISDATDFEVGDSFTVTVTAGSGAFAPLDLSAVDGSADPAGIALVPTDTTDTTRKQLAYTSGGVFPIQPGETLTGATGAATAQVVSFTLTSGTFAAGTAAGVLILDNQSGSFQSENLNSVNQSNICTVGGNSSAYNPAQDIVAIVRDAHIVPDYLVWPSGITAGQIAAALEVLKSKGILTRTEV